jgi:3-oxoacyl-[acyl-carrier-protein] synthase-3
VAQQFIASGAADTVLVVGADVMSRVTDWTDRNTCVLFGDGAGAAVVRAVPEGRGVLGFDLGSDGGGGDLLKAEINTHLFLGTSFTAGKGTATADEPCSKSYIAMDGKEVYRFAVNVMGASAVRALDRCGITPEEIDVFVPHQANVRIIDAAAKRLGLPSEKVFVNVGKYGNTSAASIPIALCEARDTGRITSGSTVVTVGFGAGLTWGSCVMRWV